LVFLLAFCPLAFPPTTYTRSSSPYSCYMPCLSHPPRLNYSNYTWRTVQIMKLFVTQFSPFSCHLISLRSKNPPQHCFQTPPSLCSSLNVRDQVSYPYRTTGKIIVLHILIFKFFDSNREDRRFWTELPHSRIMVKSAKRNT
jgi:hypothetical protein